MNCSLARQVGFGGMHRAFAAAYRQGEAVERGRACFARFRSSGRMRGNLAGRGFGGVTRYLSFLWSSCPALSNYGGFLRRHEDTAQKDAGENARGWCAGGVPAACQCLRAWGVSVAFLPAIRRRSDRRIGRHGETLTLRSRAWVALSCTNARVEKACRIVFSLFFDPC